MSEREGMVRALAGDRDEGLLLRPKNLVYIQWRSKTQDDQGLTTMPLVERLKD